MRRYKLKPIETTYKGYRFRSRLEARWAVYFDTLKLAWEYETEGFDLGELGPYLPDFWLPQVHMWAEVKANEFSDIEKKKAIKLANITGHSVLRLVGTPAFKTYMSYDPAALSYDEVAETDHLISMYHGYPIDEGRFYSNTEFYGQESFAGDWPVDHVKDAVFAARSARFEHGEKPKTRRPRRKKQ